MKKYGFWWKVEFLLNNGFWPRPYHIRIIEYLDNPKWTEANEEQVEGRFIRNKE